MDTCSRQIGCSLQFAGGGPPARQSGNQFDLQIQVQITSVEEAHLTRVLHKRSEVLDRLPTALQTHTPSSSLQSIQAAVQAPFHPRTLDDLAREDEFVEQARAAVARTRICASKTEVI